MPNKKRDVVIKGIILGTEFALFVAMSIIVFLLIGREFGAIWAAIGAVIGAIFGLAIGTKRMIKYIELMSEDQNDRNERK